MKLFDSEIKVMDVLWKEGEMRARDIADRLKREVGWSKTTTYTVIKKCLEKGAITRIDPDFVCRPNVTKEEVQQFETMELIDRMYDGAPDRLIASLLDSGKLSAEEIRRLKNLINGMENK
jgi:predicted transcriptional regulator